MFLLLSLLIYGWFGIHSRHTRRQISIKPHRRKRTVLVDCQMNRFLPARKPAPSVYGGAVLTDYVPIAVARLFMAGLVYMAVTPDDKLAGEKEFFSFPPSPLGFSAFGPDKGVLFFVTSSEYDLFNEELRQIAKQTRFAYEYVRLSTVKHFSVIKYVLTHIVPFHKQWRKQWSSRSKSRQKVIKREIADIPVAANEGAALPLAVA